MVSKMVYFVTIISLCSSAWADAPAQNEIEKFSNSTLRPIRFIQSAEGGKSDIADIRSSEQSLKGSRSHLPRALFRQSFLMVTQPFEAFGISDENDDDGEGDFFVDGHDDDAVAQEDDNEPISLEGVDFREFFKARNLFTELSYLPTSAVRLQAWG